MFCLRGYLWNYCRVLQFCTRRSKDRSADFGCTGSYAWQPHTKLTYAKTHNNRFPQQWGPVTDIFIIKCTILYSLHRVFELRGLISTLAMHLITAEGLHQRHWCKSTCTPLAYMSAYHCRYYMTSRSLHTPWHTKSSYTAMFTSASCNIFACKSIMANAFAKSYFPYGKVHHLGKGLACLQAIIISVDRRRVLVWVQCINGISLTTPLQANGKQ